MRQRLLVVFFPLAGLARIQLGPARCDHAYASGLKGERDPRRGKVTWHRALVADDAVAAAIEMHEAVREFNREGSELGRLEVDVGIGIDTGPLLLGTLGGDQHLSSGVLGEAVDTAPRIAALARSSATGLLITSRTRDCLSEPTSLQLRAIDTSLEVGSQPIALVEVLDALGERESHARRESPGSWSH